MKVNFVSIKPMKVKNTVQKKAFVLNLLKTKHYLQTFQKRFYDYVSVFPILINIVWKELKRNMMEMMRNSWSVNSCFCFYGCNVIIIKRKSKQRNS